MVGYVVRCINEKPMGGLTVAQVANHFRNVGQARITLEVVEATPRTLDATTVTFGRVATLTANDGQRSKALVAEASVLSSGTAIAAPGSALAVPKVAAPKQPALRLGAKPASKSLDVQAQVITITSDPTSMTGIAIERDQAGAAMPSADAKAASDANHPSLINKAMAYLEAIPKLVQGGTTAQKEAVATTTIDPVTSSRKPCSSAEAIKDSGNVARAQVSEEHEKPVTAAQSKCLSASAVSAISLEAAVKATAPISEVSPSIAAKGKTASASAVEASRVVVKTPTGNALSQPMCRPSSTAVTAANSSPASRASTTSAKPQASTPSLVRVVNSTKRQVEDSVPPSATTALVLKTRPSGSVAQASTVHCPKPTVVTARPLNEIAIRPEASAAKSTSSTPVQNTTQTIAVASTPPPVAIPILTPTKTGKKRGRQRMTKTTTGFNRTTSNKGKKSKSKKATKQDHESDWVDSTVDDEDRMDYDTFSSDSDLEESPSKKANHRVGKGRRRGVTDRTRHSLTIDRLIDMGFTKEDAEASVKEFGDDPDACMVWIISKIEERQFNEDLNRASIESEQSKHDEEERVRKLEKEKLVHAEKFMVVFPTSYMVCPDSTALRFKKLLQSTIDQVSGSSYLREVLFELMKLEGKSIQWYKGASRSYMLELAGRLDAALETHDVMTCCAHTSASDVSSPNGCKFVRQVFDEVKTLAKALFEMPTNQGGVPQAFLECDETTKFNLEDDGFEVIESIN